MYFVKHRLVKKLLLTIAGIYFK